MKPPLVLVILVSVLIAAVVGHTAINTRVAKAVPPDELQTPSKMEFVPGDVLVRFRSEAQAAEQALTKKAIVGSEGRRISVEMERPSGFEVVEGLRLAHVPADETLVAVAALRERPEVLYAEPNYVRRKLSTPNDPSYASQWSLKNIGQNGGAPGADIHAEAAWDVTTGSRNVVVGVIDEGVDINHPDLQANIWTNPAEIPGNGIDDDGDGLVDDVHGWDFFHNDASVYDGHVGDNETDAHGTHVSGIIGAVGNNSAGVAGVNWQVSILPMKILGAKNEFPATSSVLLTVRAYAYAKQLHDLYTSTSGARGANLRILNNSYGGVFASQAERDAIRALADSGILFVAAAGNDGRSNDRTPVFPAAYDEPNVIAVAASTRTDSPAFFSNYGARTVQMAAPGYEILSTTPNGTYSVFSGTSMAAPHVAGVAALICAVNPSISLSRLRSALLYNGDLVSGLAPTFNFSGPGTGILTGRRLSATGALAAAAESDSTPPAAVSNLRITSQQTRRFALEWGAPGDDGNSGRASLYEIRYTDADPRSDATQFEHGYKLFAPLPGASGTIQTVTVDVPFRHTNGFLSVRAVDNVGNAGSITSVPAAINPNDGDPYIQSFDAPSQLSTGGEPLNLIGDDKYTDNPYQLPFDFNFFGQNGRGLYISTNGALYFTDPPRVNDGSRAPDDAFGSTERLKGFRMIAGLWDDLRTDTRVGDDVYVVKPDPTRVIFRWQAVTYATPTGPNTTRGENPINFEIELRRDGTIITRYGDGNANLLPVVGISGGDPDTYIVASHTSESAFLNLSNAQTVVYTPRKPTPLPKPDLAINLRVTPEPATSGQLLTYQLDATDLTFDVPAEQTQVTTKVPSGTSLVSVTASSQRAIVTAPPIGSSSGVITIDFGTISLGSSGSATLVFQVNVPPGSTITNTASIKSYWDDSDPSNNTATTQTQVVEAPAFSNVRAVSAGVSHTVALKNDGTVWTWGDGTFGQLGDGTYSTTTTPVLVVNLSDVTAISAGSGHTLALKSDGTVRAWGSNQYGQLGVQDPFTVLYNAPVQVPGLSGVSALAAGGSHNLVLRSDGTVWAWGTNTTGQVGNGTFSQVVYTPVQVVGLAGVKAIGAGPNYSLAVKIDGTLWGWGSNYSGVSQTGVLGLPTGTFSTNTPVQIAGISNVATVAAGGSHVAALKTDGTLMSWGSNQFGQLGDNNGPSSSTPRAVLGLSNVIAISAGSEHTLALRNDGTVWAWGHNVGGDLGDGTSINRSAPVQVAVGAASIAIAAGNQHSVAALGNGTVRAWGVNDGGQLGDRTRVNRSSPVPVIGAFPVATPAFSPDGGSFQYPTGIILGCVTPGAIIHYTTNGSDPTEIDPSGGSGLTISLSVTTTLKARAYKPGWPASGVRTATFTFPTPSPTPTPTPVPGAANQPIAFVRQVNATGNSGADIFLMNSDGTGVVNFTNVQGDDLDPAWSPDGTRLAYTCRRNPDGSIGGPQRICVRNADGLGFALLSQTASEDFAPSWSRDGKQLAFTSFIPGFQTTVNIINADGTSRHPLNLDMLGASSPDWSPDGQRVVVAYLNSIFISRVGYYEYMGLTAGTFDSHPRFSPDGRKIVFQSSRDGQSEIYVMNSDGTNQVRLTNNPALDTAPAWSPDGSKIIFTSLRDNPMNPALYVMNADGTNQTRLADGSGATWRTAPNSNDFSSFFVRQHYLDFLNREPDASGLNFWMGEIETCTPKPQCTEIKRINVSAAFFLSIEFQQTGYLVERLYKAAYGDDSGISTSGGPHQLAAPIVRFSEFLPDTQQVGQGVVVGQNGWEAVLENNKQNFTAQFVQRSRFSTAFPTSMTPANFVDKLFTNIVVTPSASERVDAINEFGSATTTADTTARARALRRVAENSTLTQQEFNRAFVLMQFFGYLRRNPNDAPDADYTGYDFWLAKLNQFNGNFVAAEMVKAFIISSEYRNRFGP